MARDDFKAFVAKALKMATSQYKSAVAEDIKVIAKRMFNKDPTLVSQDWSQADPLVWCPSLAQLARVMTVNPGQNRPTANTNGNGFAPISIAGKGENKLTKGQAQPQGQGSQPPNVFSNSQFPPLGAPPPPPTQTYASASTSSITNTAQQKQQQSPATKSKKRKSASLFPSAASSLQTYEEDQAKAKRARRFEREIELDKQREMNGGWGDDEPEEGSGRIGWVSWNQEEPEADPNVINWDRHTIKGTSTAIEKSYLRLTSAPNPANIRPLHILEQTLEHIKNKWKSEEKPYPWICDQLKSMRQDLTVQRIKNEFTVKVYEFHARVALQSADLGEYNQCQSVLKQLYEHGLPGCAAEFLGYRILYMIHTKNMSELGRAIARLSPTQKREKGIAHALAVHAAITTGNYHRLFRLFVDPVFYNAKLMVHFVERERVAALAKISKSYMTIPLGFLARELGFADPETQVDLCALLDKHHATVFSTPTANHTIAQANHANENRRLSEMDRESLDALVWNCKANAAACEAAVAKYKVVDIKGQK